MQAENAKRFIDLLIRQCAEQNQLLAEVRPEETEKDFDKLKKIIGSIMGHIYFAGLDPLFKDHPDLEPDSIKSQRGQSAD